LKYTPYFTDHLQNIVTVSRRALSNQTRNRRYFLFNQ